MLNYQRVLVNFADVPGNILASQTCRTSWGKSRSFPHIFGAKDAENASGAMTFPDFPDDFPMTFPTFADSITDLGHF